MRSMNRITLTGHVGKDVESKGAVAKTTLAVSGSKKDQNGNWIDSTTWVNLVMFGKTAETAQQYVAKGSHIGIDGRLEISSYEKEGELKYYTSVIVNSLFLLDKKSDAVKPAASKQINSWGKTEVVASAAEAIGDMDIPF